MSGKCNDQGWMDDGGCRPVLTLHPVLAIIRPRARPAQPKPLQLKCTRACAPCPQQIHAKFAQSAGKIIWFQKPDGWQSRNLHKKSDICARVKFAIKQIAQIAQPSDSWCREEVEVACNEVL